ncbi:MAG: hypothetical protein ACREFP_10190 [Acetobacteraceae bacterium]
METQPAPGKVLEGPLFNERMRIVTAEQNGAAGWTLGLVGLALERFREVVIRPDQLAGLTLTEPQAL